jgi:hypothetical protein
MPFMSAKPGCWRQAGIATIGSCALLIAFFVGAVTFTMIEEVEYESFLGVIGFRFERSGIAISDDLPAESSDVLVPIVEDIKIFCPSPQIEKFPASLYLQNIVWRDLWSRISRGGASQIVAFGGMRAKPICWL